MRRFVQDVRKTPNFAKGGLRTVYQACCRPFFVRRACST